MTHSAINRDAAEFNFTNGWHAKLGRALKSNSEYNVECWTVDYDQQTLRTEKRDDIKYRRYPSRILPGTTAAWLKPYIGSAKPGVELSLPLLRALRRRARRNPRVAVHLHSDTYLNTYAATGLLRKIPTFLQHHGGVRGATKVERLLFPTFQHLFVLSDRKQQYLIDDVGLDSSAISIQQMGADFSRFVPGSEMRDAIPRLIYVGKYGPYKGLDRILDVFERLRCRFDVELDVVGGSASDPLYERAVDLSGVRVTTDYLPTKELIERLQRATVYVSFPKAEAVANGDCGIIAPVEALACGTPVVSPTLEYFPADVRNKVGRIPRSNDHMLEAVTEVLEGTATYPKCREVAANHFSWPTVADRVGSVYDRNLL
jgi:glycosyltransferase involved in cell wall biosynthesis